MTLLPDMRGNQRPRAHPPIAAEPGPRPRPRLAANVHRREPARLLRRVSTAAAVQLVVRQFCWCWVAATGLRPTAGSRGLSTRRAAACRDRGRL